MISCVGGEKVGEDAGSAGGGTDRGLNQMRTDRRVGQTLSDKDLNVRLFVGGGLLRLQQPFDAACGRVSRDASRAPITDKTLGGSL